MTLKTYASEINFISAIEHSPEFSDCTNAYKIIAKLDSDLHKSLRILESKLDRVKGEYILTEEHVQQIKQLYMNYYTAINKFI